MKLNNLIKKAEKLGYTYFEEDNSFSLGIYRFTWDDMHDGSFYIKGGCDCFGDFTRIHYEYFKVKDFLSLKQIYDIMKALQ